MNAFNHDRSGPKRVREQRRLWRRRAAAAVELALIAPVLAAMLVGIFELGRGLMVKQALNDAARKGCERGTLPFLPH